VRHPIDDVALDRDYLGKPRGQRFDLDDARRSSRRRLRPAVDAVDLREPEQIAPRVEPALWRERAVGERLARNRGGDPARRIDGELAISPDQAIERTVGARARKARTRTWSRCRRE